MLFSFGISLWLLDLFEDIYDYIFRNVIFENSILGSVKERKMSSFDKLKSMFGYSFFDIVI